MYLINVFIIIFMYTKSLVPPTSELSSHSVCATITDHIIETYIFATGENDYFPMVTQQNFSMQLTKKQVSTNYICTVSPTAKQFEHDLINLTFQLVKFTFTCFIRLYNHYRFGIISTAHESIITLSCTISRFSF